MVQAVHILLDADDLLHDVDAFLVFALGKQGGLRFFGGFSIWRSVASSSRGGGRPWGNKIIRI